MKYDLTNIAGCLFIISMIGVGILINAYCFMPSPIHTKTYSYNGEIINVRFIEAGFLESTPSKTVVHFKDGEYLVFYNELHYGIQTSPNATINYSVNKYDRMFFNSITYEN